MAKDFSTLKTESRVQKEISEATRKTGQQDTAPAEEAERRKAERKTRGRKGAKQPRLSVAFSTDNYDYIQICSRVTGVNMIDFVNMVIQKHREAHPEEYAAAKDFLKRFDLTVAEAEALERQAPEGIEND